MQPVRGLPSRTPWLAATFLSMYLAFARCNTGSCPGRMLYPFPEYSQGDLPVIYERGNNMSMPKSVTKIKKDGVEFTSNVDRANYTIRELTRAALKDVGRFIVKQTKNRIKKRTGILYKHIQYWVRPWQMDLQVGFKPEGWYGMYQEMGSTKTPKIGALRDAVESNIDMIQEIEGKYLSAIEDDIRAANLIDEAEYEGGE